MGRKRCPEKPDKTGHAGEAREGPDAGLTAQQDRAVDALVQEPTVARAATAVGVSERTLRRWLREPEFHSALLAARREAFGQAIGLTQRYAPVAVATLVKVMNDTAATPSAKVTAAAVLLRFGREGIELDDLAQRVEMLERTSKASGAPGAVAAAAAWVNCGGAARLKAAAPTDDEGADE